MRELHLKMSISLDRFVAGPNGELDWFFQHRHPLAAAWTVAAISDASLHIMGARTFRDMINWWPYATDAFAPAMNSIPKAVFTRRGAASLRDATTTQAIKDATKAAEARGEPRTAADPDVLRGWQEAYVAAGPIKDELIRLKQADGKPIMAHGGAGFARSLIATRMVDEFKFVVFPVALGKGLPIFSDLDGKLNLNLVDSTRFPNGVMAQVYRPA